MELALARVEGPERVAEVQVVALCHRDHDFVESAVHPPPIRLQTLPQFFYVGAAGGPGLSPGATKILPPVSRLSGPYTPIPNPPWSPTVDGLGLCSSIPSSRPPPHTVSDAVPAIVRCGKDGAETVHCSLNPPGSHFPTKLVCAIAPNQRHQALKVEASP